MKLLALTAIILSLAACSVSTQQPHVAKAAELCKNNGGWKTIDPYTQLIVGHYKMNVRCMDGAEFNNVYFNRSTDHAPH